MSAHVVRQRLRLAAAAPELMTAYREERLALDQLTAFCVSEDQDRQRQVLEQIGPHTPAYAIRRAMTESKVRADDRRAAFVGSEAYEAEGGSILRDLFTEDGGGWFRPTPPPPSPRWFTPWPCRSSIPATECGRRCSFGCRRRHSAP